MLLTRGVNLNRSCLLWSWGHDETFQPGLYWLFPCQLAESLLRRSLAKNIMAGLCIDLQFVYPCPSNCHMILWLFIYNGSPWVTHMINLHYQLLISLGYMESIVIPRWHPYAMARAMLDLSTLIANEKTGAKIGALLPVSSPDDLISSWRFTSPPNNG